MAQNSKIQWTTHTFNPWVGCEKVSVGCANCYAEAYDKRVGGVPKQQRDDPTKPTLRWGKGAPRTLTSPAYWRAPLRWDKAAASAGERHRVFCASLADVFDPAVPQEWRDDLFGLIASTSNLDWLLLTKRPEMIRALWPLDLREPGGGGYLHAYPPGENWPNVWLGTTVENQEQAEKRIPRLLDLPATVRFLSCEPLLGPVNLSRWIDEDENGFTHPLQWVIVGGESGAKARPFHVDWARSLVGQCRDADVAPFVKQLGARPVFPSIDDLQGDVVRELDANGYDAEQIAEAARDGRVQLKDAHGGDWNEWPADLRVREFPR